MGANNLSQQIAQVRDRIDLLKERTRPTFIILIITEHTGEKIIRANGTKDIDENTFDQFSKEIENGEIRVWSIIDDMYVEEPTTEITNAKGGN